MPISAEIIDVLSSAKDVAKRYYVLTRKPLGITGEIAEMEAARLLGLELAPPRQRGWDASRQRADGSSEKLQIKGRWLMNGSRPSAKVGAIDVKSEFDAVLLVLLDADLSPMEILRAERSKVVAALTEKGSIARTVRGQMSISKFRQISIRVWPIPTRAIGTPFIWPDEVIGNALKNAEQLEVLCGPKRRGGALDRREGMLEKLVANLIGLSGTVTLKSRISKTLGIYAAPFPGNTQPDIVLQAPDGVHICEIKVSRRDDARFECVFESKPFIEFLAPHHAGDSPWEVEQDLLKLQAMYTLSDSVASCRLMILDGYAGSGRSWTMAFSSEEGFVNTMRTSLIKRQAAAFVSNVRIQQIDAGEAKARLIVCDIPRPN
jgi:hypothetical protein